MDTRQVPPSGAAALANLSQKTPAENSRRKLPQKTPAAGLPHLEGLLAMNTRHPVTVPTRLLGLALLCLVALPAAIGWAGDDNRTDRSDWEQRVEKLDKADARAAFALALQLEAKGHKDLAQKAYEIVIGIEPEHRAARRALGFEQVEGRWLDGDDRMRAKGLVRHLKRWMTKQEFAESTRPQREAADQKAGELRILHMLAKLTSADEDVATAARRRLALEDRQYKLSPLAQALRCEPAELRIYAAQELARLGDTLAAPALLKRAIYDKDAKVREQVVLALKSFDLPSTVHPLGRALWSRSEDVRVHAAEALGTLGDEMGLGYLTRKWEGRSGDFPKVYFSQVRQISYIQDFDVEVAQTSFIADPIVGVIQEGVVQAVKIHATEQSFTYKEQTAVKGALNKIAGEDLGDKVGPWSKFWRKDGTRLMDERRARYAQAAADAAKAEAEKAAAAK